MRRCWTGSTWKMPAERVHLLAAVAMGAYLLPGALKAGLAPAVAFSAGYLLGTLFLCPDLDLERSACLRRWGRLGGFWRAWWRHVPHRGMSHSPAGLLVYVVLATLPPAAVLTLAGYSPEPRVLGAYVAGIAIPHQLHVLIDGLWSALKRAA